MVKIIASTLYFRLSWGQSPTLARLSSQNVYKAAKSPSIKSNTNPFGALRPLIKPMIFTTAFIGSCHTVATICHYERNKFRLPFYNERRVQPQSISDILKYGLTLGMGTVATIFVVNMMVFICWRLAPNSKFMYRYFMNAVENIDGPRSLAKIRCLPMLLSGFSHISFLHLAFNMVAFDSFSKDVYIKMGPEHFLALFLSACVFSSFCSSAFRLFMKSRQPSLGASGGLMAMIYFSAITSPDSQFGIIGLPTSHVRFNALTGVQCLFLVDLVGLLLRWSRLDHAAHLGGALIGILYANYRFHSSDRYRKPIVETWAKVTKP